MIKVLTKFPLALDSPDFITPWGTMRDNSTNPEFIKEVITRFENKKINFLDLGCSGGKLIRDFIPFCEYSVGLEGSNYSIINQRAEWPDLYLQNLFTCDVSKPFDIFHDVAENGIQRIHFDCITAWELIEHLKPESLDTFFHNVYKHLKDNGIFVCSISWASEMSTGIQLHQTIWKENQWNEYFAKLGLFVEAEEKIKNYVRVERESFHRTFRKVIK